MTELTYAKDNLTNKVSFAFTKICVADRNINDGVLFRDVVTHDEHYYNIEKILDTNGRWKELAMILLKEDEPTTKDLEDTVLWYEAKGGRSKYVIGLWKGRRCATRYNFVQALLDIGEEGLAEYILDLPLLKK